MGCRLRFKITEQTKRQKINLINGKYQNSNLKHHVLKYPKTRILLDLVHFGEFELWTKQ